MARSGAGAVESLFFFQKPLFSGMKCRYFCLHISGTGLEEKFQMRNNIPASNLVCFDHQGNVAKYDSMPSYCLVRCPNLWIWILVVLCASGLCVDGHVRPMHSLAADY